MIPVVLLINVSMQDLCSYKKEVLADDADYNAVTVIMNNNGTDVAGAVQFISDTHDGLVERCLRLCDDILAKRGFPSFGEDLDCQIAVYVDGIGTLGFRPVALRSVCLQCLWF
jgi:hypothetical protein